MRRRSGSDRSSDGRSIAGSEIDGKEFRAGGYLGQFLGGILSDYLNMTGSIILILTLLLLAVILGIASVGIYSLNGNVMDLYLLIFFGAAGYVFRRLEMPIPPLILALVLGGMMEQSFRQAMTISGGNPNVLVGSPITIVLLVLIIAALVVPYAMKRLKVIRAARLVPEGAD